MPDDLRTRIAAALTDQIVNDAAVILRRYGASGEVQLSVDTNALADAVIRELRLRKVTDVNRAVPQHRYVTEWTTDE